MKQGQRPEWAQLNEKWTFQSVGCQLRMNNQGVGAEGLLAAQSVLAADGDDFGNDGRVEHLWVLKAIGDLHIHNQLVQKWL